MTEPRPVKIRCLGSGDAFGSGGRLQSCFCVEADEWKFLVECGASALISMRKFNVDPNTIDTILVTHLHGDHFGGIPFFLLDAYFVSRRKTPLTLGGPPGLEQRLRSAQEVLYPGSSGLDLGFELNIVEMQPGSTVEFTNIPVTAFPVEHSSGAPSLALRLLLPSKILTWSGDTEWVPAVADATWKADLLVCECYTYDKKIPGHMDFAALHEGLSDTQVKRVLLTHMSADMLERPLPSGFERAEDGLQLEV